MKLWRALSSALRGWYGIVMGRQDWRDHFSLTWSGLATALVIYFFTAFLVMAYGAIQTGMPGAVGVMVNLSVQGLFLLGLTISVVLTRMVLKSEARIRDFLVPGFYALSFFLLVGSLMASVDASIGTPFALVALAILLFRLARMAGDWTIGVSLAFAVFTPALLVGMPITLYMLTNPAGSPI